MKKQLALAAALTSMVVGLLVPTAAHAATGSKHARVVTVASSSAWVLYKRQVSSTNLTPFSQKGDVLFVTDAAGNVQRLKGFRGFANDRVLLVGNTVVQASRTSDPGVFQQRVRYLDLPSGRTAQVPGKPGDLLVAAAPEGWVVQRPTQAPSASDPLLGLVKVGIDGSETRLGSPFRGGEGAEFWVQSSESGLIAYEKTVDEACATSRVRFLPWTEPGGWRTVYGGAAHSCIECAPASNTSVACRATKPDRGLVVVSLRGGAPRWLRSSHPKLCQAVDYVTSRDDLVAIERTNAFGCTKGAVYRFGANKKVAISTRHYSAQASVHAGLDGILVSKGQQQVVYGLTGVTRTPTVVAPR